MLEPSLHSRLAEIAPRVIASSIAGDAELAEAEAHAAAGCSTCARALVNAGDVGVVLASAGADVAPPGALRDRILAQAREVSRPRSPGARRFFDPSGEIARLHIGAPGDAERTAEVDALGAGAPDACARFLAQLERIIAFPLLFVSVVRGDRVGYRVQRGLHDGGDPQTPVRGLVTGAAEMRDRRRETTFCTHTVSGDAPLVVPNAGAEPFFRGSNMVLRHHVKAYAGVPLRTSRGLVIGTLCAMDYRPRAMGPEILGTLQLFAEPVLAEIERARLTEDARVERTLGGAPIHGAAWFRRLVEAEIARGRPPAMIVAERTGAAALADAAHEGEPVGRLAPDAVGLLIPGADARTVEQRAEALSAAIAVRVSAAENYFP